MLPQVSWFKTLSHYTRHRGLEAAQVNGEAEAY